MRVNACELLGNIGSEAKEAIPALREATKDKNEFVRRAAAALKKIEAEE